MSVSEEKYEPKVTEEPSHIMTGDYAVLMETSGEEMESWYYFIRVEGNQENLKHLQDQLESVDWYILDDLSTFDLDLDHFVSAQTAKEMTKVELNHCSFHRKFDGKLKKIDLGLTKKDKNKKKIKKVFDILGYGSIEELIDDEDLDPEDLLSGSESDFSEDTDDESVSSSSSSSESEGRRRGGGRHKKNYDNLPPSIRVREAIKNKQDERRRGNKNVDV